VSKKKSKSSHKLKEEMMEHLSTQKQDTKRGFPVMTRLNMELIDMLDILVKLDIFKSKSEAVASIVEKVLMSQRDNFEQLKSEITKIEKIQDSAKEIVADTLKS
jgi:Arc/MetJ-type ribon-helix-helix transcriptional regulator